MLHNVSILLVLVVWPVRLDDTLYSVDGAGYPVGSNEFGKIPVDVSVGIVSS